MIIVPLPVGFPEMDRGSSVFVDGTKPNISDAAALASNHTFVIKLQPNYITDTGNYIRLVVSGPGTAGTTTTISNTFIGKPALSGDAWDFLASPTRVTWGGNNALTLKQGETITSDIIAYTLEDVPTIISFDIASGSVVSKRTGVNNSYAVSYYKASTTEAGTANKGSGYTVVGGTVYLLNRIEVGD